MTGKIVAALAIAVTAYLLSANNFIPEGFARPPQSGARSGELQSHASNPDQAQRAALSKAIASSLVTAIPQDVMLGQARAAAAWTSKPGARGLQISATVIPPAARILVAFTPSNQDPQTQECSGVLVGSRTVLTAAHCICGRKAIKPWFASTAAQCAKLLPNISVVAIFPSAGLFRSEAAPSVNPAYRSPEAFAIDETKAVGDLAVFSLAKSPHINPAHIGQADPSNPHLLSSFGGFSWTNVPKGTRWVANAPYQTGVEQISIQPTLRVKVEDCGGDGAADTICTPYSGLRTTSGLDRDAGVCGGDSGAPLFEREGPEFSKVVGITSYFAPAGEGCEAFAARRSVYVELSRYRAWVLSQIVSGEPLTKFKPSVCGELIALGPGAYSVPTPHSGLLTVSTFDQDGLDRPKVDVSSSAGTCMRALDESFGSCHFEQGGSLIVKVSGGLSQLTACWEQ